MAYEKKTKRFPEKTQKMPKISKQAPYGTCYNEGKIIKDLREV